MTPKQHYMNLIDRALSQPVLTHSGARLAWFTLERITEHCRARGWDVIEILGGKSYEEYTANKTIRHDAVAREQYRCNRARSGTIELLPNGRENQEQDDRNNSRDAAGKPPNRTVRPESNLRTTGDGATPGPNLALQ